MSHFGKLEEELWISHTNAYILRIAALNKRANRNTAEERRNYRQNIMQTDHITSDPLAVMKNTIKVDLPAEPDTATRIVLPKKPPTGTTSLSNKICISTKLDGEPMGTTVYTPAPLKLQGKELIEGQPRKRREIAEDDEVREQLIYKILNESSKKLKKKAENQAEIKHEQQAALRPRLDPPCVKLISRPQSTCLVLPSAITYRQLFNSQTPRPKRTISDCECGRKARYRDPGTLRFYCSVPCFRVIKRTNL